MLLIGGGIILIIGLFTGKITFPGGSPGGSLLAGILKPGGPINSPTNVNPPPTNNYGNGKGWINPLPNGSCPAKTHPIHVSGGKLACQFD